MTNDIVETDNMTKIYDEYSQKLSHKLLYFEFSVDEPLGLDLKHENLEVNKVVKHTQADALGMVIGSKVIKVGNAEVKSFEEFILQLKKCYNDKEETILILFSMPNINSTYAKFVYAINCFIIKTFSGLDNSNNQNPSYVDLLDLVISNETTANISEDTRSTSTANVHIQQVEVLKEEKGDLNNGNKKEKLADSSQYDIATLTPNDGTSLDKTSPSKRGTSLDEFVKPSSSSSSKKKISSSGSKSLYVANRYEIKEEGSSHGEITPPAGTSVALKEGGGGYYPVQVSTATEPVVTEVVDMPPNAGSKVAKAPPARRRSSNKTTPSGKPATAFMRGRSGSSMSKECFEMV